MKAMAYYTKKRVQAIVCALEKYHQFRETDSLHRVRVELKKLKSVIMVLGFADRKFDAHEHYLSLRGAFRKAGQIRQRALLAELMLSYGVEGLPLEQLGEPQRLEAKFRADIPFFIPQVEKLGKKLRPRMKKVRRKDVAGYVMELEEFIRDTFVPRLNPRRLHAARKRMKQRVYLTRFYDGLLKEDRKFYSDMENAIGVLHDKEILLEYLAGMPRGVATTSKTLLRSQIATERKAISTAATVFYRN